MTLTPDQILDRADTTIAKSKQNYDGFISDPLSGTKVPQSERDMYERMVDAAGQLSGNLRKHTPLPANTAPEMKDLYDSSITALDEMVANATLLEKIMERRMNEA